MSIVSCLLTIIFLTFFLFIFFATFCLYSIQSWAQFCRSQDCTVSYHRPIAWVPSVYEVPGREVENPLGF